MSKDTAQYKDYISKEYDRLFSKDQTDAVEKPYYYFVMYGSEGIEYFKCIRDQSEISYDQINSLKLTARFNSHRNLGVYAFKLSKLMPEVLITDDFFSREGVIKIY